MIFLTPSNGLDEFSRQVDALTEVFSATAAESDLACVCAASLLMITRALDQARGSGHLQGMLNTLQECVDGIKEQFGEKCDEPSAPPRQVH